MNQLTQFVILSGMGKRWLPDALIAEINGNLHPEDEQRQRVLRSCFSWKDQNAVAIVRKLPRASTNSATARSGKTGAGFMFCSPTA